MRITLFLLALAGCAGPSFERPPYNGPGAVWSYEPVQAAEVAQELECLAPAVATLLARPREGWADQKPTAWVLRETFIDGKGNALTTTVRGEDVILLGQAAFADLRRVLAHELVHWYLRDLPSLPLAVEEGLADQVVCRVVPEALEAIQSARLKDLPRAPSAEGVVQFDVHDWHYLTLQQDQLFRARGWEIAARLGRARLLELIAEAQAKGEETVDKSYFRDGN